MRVNLITTGATIAATMRIDADLRQYLKYSERRA